MTRDLRWIIGVHVGLVAALATSALFDAPARGWVVLGAVIAYNVVLPLTAIAVGRRDWLALWAFLMPLSIFQVLPDWVLAAQVGTLRFPPLGGIRVDDVIPLAMAGMWVAPLFAVVILARRSAGLAAVLSLVVFLGAEFLAPTLGLWEPAGDLTQVAGVALYVLPAEAALGWATWTGFQYARGRSWPRVTAVALAVSTFYLGALVLSFFVIDAAHWRLTI